MVRAVHIVHENYIVSIEELVKDFKAGNQFETLLGVAGQLYGEFKEYFPENAVEYFVSYYETA